MTQSPSDTLTPYAPLPVRARGTLEIFDTAFKLFRRYAGVLLAWSALSSIINLIPILGALTYVFTMPLMFGAVSCVVAGAVRGQNVTFKQVWGFTKPRYGALLGVLILAIILMGVVVIALTFIVALIVILIASTAANFGWFATAVTWVIGTVLGLIGSSFLLAVVMGWFNLAPVIACLEDANRGSNALSRAWSLLSGNWRKACGVATILTLAGTAAFMIILGFVMFFFYGGWDKFVGADTSFATGLAVSGFTSLFFVVWTPLQAVVGAVFYLDLRTRKEALDLEWTNYAAKPEVTANQEQNAPAPAYSPPTQLTPMGAGPYAPPVSPQAPAPPNFSPQPQTPVFAAQAPTQIPSGEVPVAPAPVEVEPVNIASEANSFAAFASQMETAPQDVAFSSPPAVSITKEPSAPEMAVSPSGAAPNFQAGAPQEVISTPSVPTPPVVVQPEPAFSEPPTIPVEVAPATSSASPTFGLPANVASPGAVQPLATPTAPEQPFSPPTLPAPEPTTESGETSSFAPRRFRRPASEEDDYPSSFGGGTR